MHKRQLTIVGIVLVAAAILFAVTTFRQEAQSNKPQQQQEEATVVKKGQVTEKEREYSKEYKKLYEHSKDRKLSEIIERTQLIRKGTEEIRVEIGFGEPEVIDYPDAPVISTADFLRALSCSADAIIVGSVISKSAHLSEDETFVYSEYEFSVKNILKNNSVSPIKVNNSVEVTRPGGIVIINNQRIRVEDSAYEPLQKNKEYVLFLRFVRSANGYVVASEEGDFALENNSFKRLTKQALPEDLKSGNNLQKLLSDVHTAVTSGCNKSTQGDN